MPQSGITVEPSTTAPASRTRAVTGASWSGTTESTPALPAGIGTPRRARFSLRVTGTPSSGPSGSPDGPPLLAGPGRGGRRRGVPLPERVEHRLPRLDDREDRVVDLDGGELPGGEGPQHLHRRQGGEPAVLPVWLGHVLSPPGRIGPLDIR